MEGDNPFTVPQTPFNKAPFPHIALFSPTWSWKLSCRKEMGKGLEESSGLPRGPRDEDHFRKLVRGSLIPGCVPGCWGCLEE